MWKHLSKKTKLSCSGARKGHFVRCATREDVHYISTLENTSRSAKVPWGHAKWIHSTRIKYLKYTICCNLNTRSNMHPIVKIITLFASWEVRIGKQLWPRPWNCCFFKNDVTFFCYTDRPFAGKKLFFFLSPILSEITCFNCWLAPRLIVNAVLKRLTNWTFQEKFHFQTSCLMKNNLCL